MTAPWVEALAIVAPVLTGITVAVLTNLHYSRLARESRLADKQADAYVMLAEHTVRLRQYALVAHPDLSEDDPLMPLPLTEEDRYRMFAHVEAYGSDEALVAYDRLLVAAARTRTAVASLGTARALPPPFTPDDLRYRTDSLDDARKAKAELQAACKEVLDLIHAELHSTRGALPSRRSARRLPRLRRVTIGR